MTVRQLVAVLAPADLLLSTRPPVDRIHTHPHQHPQLHVQPLADTVQTVSAILRCCSYSRRLFNSSKTWTSKLCDSSSNKKPRRLSPGPVARERSEPPSALPLRATSPSLSSADDSQESAITVQSQLRLAATLLQIGCLEHARVPFIQILQSCKTSIGTAGWMTSD